MAEDLDGWIVTYSDMVTLLLTFFVLLMTMAVFTPEKVVKGIYSIKTSFGVVGGNISPLEKTFAPLEEYTLEGIDHSAIMQLKKMIKSLPFADKIKLGLTKRGLIIGFSADLLFAPGSARLNARILSVLDKIGQLINSCKNQVLVEGYTDSTPIRRGKYRSNWELSMARALAVISYFIDQKGLPPNRFVAVGYGPTHPLFPNDTPEHRAKNRRVWIVLKGKPVPVSQKEKEEVEVKGFIFKIFNNK